MKNPSEWISIRERLPPADNKIRLGWVTMYNWENPLEKGIPKFIYWNLKFARPEVLCDHFALGYNVITHWKEIDPPIQME